MLLLMKLLPRVGELARIFLQKMTQNEIVEILNHLRKIKSGEVKLTRKAKSIVKMVQRVLDGISDECKTNLTLKRLEPHLLELFEGNTSLSYNYELNGFDLSKYMDCLGKNLNDVQMIFLEIYGSPIEEKLAIL
ncbi:hypothetical protein R3W88_016594 [Solanum pinnatisectum]|uniref:Uncharacterized protein n=1 Tax=Solanum pinnatisectum TaxID=50273 RepID=A0AAV9KXT5_9SOLN|nr:hypothetical protein R3W88_016594 [Solanum pinnatisectum]